MSLLQNREGFHAAPIEGFVKRIGNPQRNETEGVDEQKYVSIRQIFAARVVRPERLDEGRFVRDHAKSRFFAQPGKRIAAKEIYMLRRSEECPVMAEPLSVMRNLIRGDVKQDPPSRTQVVCRKAKVIKRVLQVFEYVPECHQIKAVARPHAFRQSAAADVEPKFIPDGVTHPRTVFDGFDIPSSFVGGDHKISSPGPDFQHPYAAPVPLEIGHTASRRPVAKDFPERPSRFLPCRVMNAVCTGVHLGQLLIRGDRVLHDVAAFAAKEFEGCGFIEIADKRPLSSAANGARVKRNRSGRHTAHKDTPPRRNL